jgi:cobalt/nickel transport system permease protein
MMRLDRIAVVMIILTVCLAGTLRAEEKWQGIDETIVGKIAREHGREPREPLINTGEGDMLLFAFLTAGAIGGFAAGYYWRVLMEGKRKPDAEK